MVNVLLCERDGKLMRWTGRGSMRAWEFLPFVWFKTPVWGFFFFRRSKESAVFWSRLFSSTFMSVPFQTAYFRSRYLSVSSMSGVWKTFKSRPTSFGPSRLPRREIKAPRCCGSVCVCLCGHCWQKRKLWGERNTVQKRNGNGLKAHNALKWPLVFFCINTRSLGKSVCLSGVLWSRPTLFMMDKRRSGWGWGVRREQKQLAKKGGELSPCCIVLFLQIENPRYLRENPIPLSPVSAKAS